MKRHQDVQATVNLIEMQEEINIGFCGDNVDDNFGIICLWCYGDLMHGKGGWTFSATVGSLPASTPVCPITTGPSDLQVIVRITLLGLEEQLLGGVVPHKGPTLKL